MPYANELKSQVTLMITIQLTDGCPEPRVRAQLGTRFHHELKREFKGEIANLVEKFVPLHSGHEMYVPLARLGLHPFGEHLLHRTYLL